MEIALSFGPKRAAASGARVECYGINHESDKNHGRMRDARELARIAIQDILK
jgi:hypothetical protein